MIHFIRSFFGSKLGIAITIAFVAVIGLAFAIGDVASSGTFGGVSGGDRVAVVGDDRIDASELSMNLTNALEEAKQQDPTLTMQVFLARGGMDQVLDQLLQRSALAEFAREHGMRAGDRLIDSELLQIPQFRGADGNFDKNAFLAVIRQRGLSEEAVRNDFAMNLLARQLLTPITFTPVMPESMGRQYAALLRETRKGSIAAITSAAFAPTRAPTNAELQAYYRAHDDDFIRPERRVIRFATFGEEALGDLPAPTAAQISQRYQRDRAQYAPSVRRRFTQLVVPTQDAARAIIAEVNGGKSLETAAREKGLATASVGPVTQSDFANLSSAAVAQAAFAARQGALAAPARGGLGWFVLRVDAIDNDPGKTLAQATPEITAALAVEQRRQAINDLSARIEEEFDDGNSLADVARELKLELTTTKPATADGRVYGSPTETVPPVLGRVLEVAFDMEEQEPQVTELTPGETFMIFDVSSITPSATAPLPEIRDDVIASWRRSEGSKGAKAAADRIMGRVNRGMTLAAAVAAENKPLPPPQAINLNRQQLSAAGRVPAELALFFSMAERTTKKLAVPNDAGWFVMRLDDIDAPQVAANDPLVLQTMNELAQALGQEYVRQFVTATQKEVGVERNQNAIDAVRRQLTGEQAD
jgi:peptidyl-prolyl cis-trans isomerase D